ncbi:unnamed protein product [Caenorhabditis brenneri]
MSSPNAPLSYDSVKAVLQYMDPNQRALLTHRCPEVKTRDSLLPQKITTVCVEPAQISINDTTYQMGIVIQYPEGATPPKSHVDMNKWNGTQQDLDRYGFSTFRPIGTPGDIYVPGNHPVTHEGFRLRYENRLKTIETKREELMQRRDILLGSPNSEKSLEELEKTIADVEAELVPFRLKEGKKEDVPYVLYLQLTVLTKGPNGEKIEAIERIEYNRPLGSAFTYLIRRLLNKRELTHVDTLRITSMRKSDFFWLPTEINLTANHLSIDTHAAANIVGAIELFIHPDHRRPFRTVTLSLNRELNYNEGVLNTAGTLIIGHVSHTFLYGTIGHRRVKFDFCLDVRSFDYIYYQWRRGAPIGTHYFSYTYPVKGSQWYDYVTTRIGDRYSAETPSRGVQCLPECVILPLTDHTQLEFYITPLIHPVTSFFGRECTMMVNLEIQPRRHFD